MSGQSDNVKSIIGTPVEIILPAKCDPRGIGHSILRGINPGTVRLATSSTS